MPWQNSSQLTTFHGTIEAQPGLTTQEKDSLHAAANAIPVAPMNSIIVCGSDSLTQGTGTINEATQSYPARLQANLGSTYTVVNKGVGGNRIANVNVPDLTAQFNPAAPRNVLYLWVGTNDAYDGRDGAAIYADFVALAQACRAQRPDVTNLKIVAVTIIARQQPGLPASFPAAQQSFNDSLLANWPTNFDGVFAPHQSAKFQNPADTTRFADGVHLVAAAYEDIADYAAAVLPGMYP